uniref:Reverse transcriptase zinc-binding domain-containing protein n=1 Tax=Chenopodium quinoa TaxID=63459 RepID=A0A803LTB7_CHEQI
MEGLHWRVGNGTKIEAWKEKWVPDSTGFITPTPPANGLHDNDLVVANLIDYNTSSWNEEELALHFIEEDRDKIRNIPLMPQAGNDTLFWGLSVNGSYTVKSAYWLGMRGNVTRQAPTVNAVWKHIWQLDGPPKLRHFLWRAVSGTLAVKVVLHRRHIVTDPFCQRCQNEEETICHALMGCCCVKQIWEVSDFWEDIQCVGTESFAEFFMRMVGKLSQNELSVFSALLWVGWTSRNKALYDETHHDPQQLASGFVKYTLEYKQYSERVYSRVLYGDASSLNQWQKPPTGVLKLNVDAAILRDRTVGVGVAARDSEGKLDGQKRCVLYRENLCRPQCNIVDIVFHGGCFYAFEVNSWRIGMIDPNLSPMQVLYKAGPAIVQQNYFTMSLITVDNTLVLVVENDIRRLDFQNRRFRFFVLRETWEELPSLGPSSPFLSPHSHPHHPHHLLLLDV